MAAKLAFLSWLGLRRKAGVALWFLLAAGSLAVLLYPLWLTAVGEFLVVSTSLEPADVVVVMGGGGTHRVDRGIELYRQGLSRSGKLFITGGPLETDLFAEGTWAAMGAKYAAAKGVPPEDLVLADWTESTYDDARAVQELLTAKGFSSAIIVSDIFHMRRTMWTMGKLMPGVRLLAASASTPSLSVDRWWTREREFLFVETEYLKLALYLMKNGP